MSSDVSFSVPVARLESFPPDVKSRIERGGSSDLPTLQNAGFADLSDILIKALGATEWVEHEIAPSIQYVMIAVDLPMKFDQTVLRQGSGRPLLTEP